MARQRKYYRVLVHRFPPYSPINGDYYLEEDLYAGSAEGAENLILAHDKRAYGRYIPVKVTEITKEEFRGHHATKHVNEVDNDNS